MERLTVCRLLACHTAQNHGVDFIILDPPSRIVFASVINKIWAFKYKAGHCQTSLLLVRFLDQRRGWFTVFIKFFWSYWTHGRQQERRGNWKRPKVEVEVLSSALFGCCFNSDIRFALWLPSTVIWPPQHSQVKQELPVSRQIFSKRYGGKRLRKGEISMTTSGPRQGTEIDTKMNNLAHHPHTVPIREALGDH